MAARKKMFGVPARADTPNGKLLGYETDYSKWLVKWFRNETG
jgi:hypothetical protein